MNENATPLAIIIAVFDGKSGWYLWKKNVLYINSCGITDQAGYMSIITAQSHVVFLGKKNN